ncbi:hypothetical protein O181_077447, partial [Austropuccinia psidii MF-1]|nr:hypothetical protein [Austropuccinia psidii MF-1]
YIWHHELLPNWNPTSSNRILVFGDIHGMLTSLQTLLQKLNYNSNSDTVLLLGDLAAKHPSIQASLDTIKYCRQSKFEAVRGNHDQYIIVWRNWMVDHRNSFVTNQEIKNYKLNHQASLELDLWLQTHQPSSKLKHKLPKGMKWKSQHFEIARRLPKVDFEWMLSKSLTLYLHPLRMFFVHAGMLPWSLPNDLTKSSDSNLKQNKDSLLSLKENNDPYTLLEMRGLKKGREPTKNAKKGKPWYKVWNKAMSACHQTSRQDDGWCQESYHIAYGHWAGKGLTLKSWSTGLDSGCVFGRQLSGLILGGEQSVNDDQVHQFQIKIHQQNVTIAQISCPEPSSHH